MGSHICNNYILSKEELSNALYDAWIDGYKEGVNCVYNEYVVVTKDELIDFWKAAYDEGINDERRNAK